MTRPIPSPERVQALREKYGLQYQVTNALTAEVMVGLEGKRVLEVGGSLPAAFVLDELKVASWLALEELAYYDVSGAAKPGAPDGVLLEDVDAPVSGYRLAFGRIERFPAHLAGSFDVVFSTAAFEHIADLKTGLLKMHEALVSGGYLVSIFSPIWSSFNGHHLHPITDKRGVTFSFQDSCIPAWGHLLMSPSQLRQHMAMFTDEETAGQIVFQVYEATSINRLFSEDYAALANASPFTVLRVDPTFEAEVPPEVQQALEARHSGYRQFSNNGLRIVLRKD